MPSADNGKFRFYSDTNQTLFEELLGSNLIRYRIEKHGVIVVENEHALAQQFADDIGGYKRLK